jgi:hypothetical protein
LLDGEPVRAAAQQPTGPEQRILGLAAVPEGVLLVRRRTSSTQVRASFTTWNASSTRTAFGSWAVSAVA